MTDRISKRARSANMAAIRAEGTSPERIVRGLLSQMGFRYRLHREDLPGRPDIVFPGRKKSSLFTGAFGTPTMWRLARGFIVREAILHIGERRLLETCPVTWQSAIF